MRFSERIGKANIRQGLQIESMDDALRAALWNVVFNRVLGGIQLPHTGEDDEAVDCLHKEIWSEFFKHSADEMPQSLSKFVADAKRRFFGRL
jgi:hypothetical protein